ncbi:MAG: hypothetical protein ACRCSG_05590, partial [Cellulosilyticaceae bacterium]
MTNEITGNCIQKEGMDSPDTIYRYFGKDTIICSRSVGNTVYTYLDDTTLKIHSHFNHTEWFPDDVIFADTSSKLYHTLYIEEKYVGLKLKTPLFLREESNQIVLHSNSKDSALNFDQVLFYYNAKPMVDIWKVRNIFFSSFYIYLKEKQYNAKLQDTLYQFHFSEKASDGISMDMHISKKYGFVGFKKN